MRVVEAVSIGMELDPWLSLEALSRYSGLSVRSLRAHLADPGLPLPHYRMREPHVIQQRAAGGGSHPRTVTGKILVRRSEFDAWMQAFRHVPDVGRVVDEVLSSLGR